MTEKVLGFPFILFWNYNIDHKVHLHRSWPPETGAPYVLVRLIQAIYCAVTSYAENRIQ